MLDASCESIGTGGSNDTVPEGIRATVGVARDRRRLRFALVTKREERIPIHRPTPVGRRRRFKCKICRTQGGDEDAEFVQRSERLYGEECEPAGGAPAPSDYRRGSAAGRVQLGAVCRRTVAATRGGNAIPIKLFGLSSPGRRVATATPGWACLRPRRQWFPMRSAERDVVAAPRERYQCPTAVLGSAPVVAGRSRVGVLGGAAR